MPTCSYCSRRRPRTQQPGRPVHAGLMLLAAIAMSACGGDATSPAVTPGSGLVASVIVSPGTATLALGDTLRLTATVKDSTGAVLTDRALTWASSDTTAATVDATGLVTARAPDTVTITATVDGTVGAAALHGVLRFTQIAPAMEATCALIKTGTAYC